MSITSDNVLTIGYINRTPALRVVFPMIYSISSRCETRTLPIFYTNTQLEYRRPACYYQQDMYFLNNSLVLDTGDLARAYAEIHHRLIPVHDMVETPIGLPELSQFIHTTDTVVNNVLYMYHRTTDGVHFLHNPEWRHKPVIGDDSIIDSNILNAELTYVSKYESFEDYQIFKRSQR